MVFLIYIALCLIVTGIFDFVLLLNVLDFFFCKLADILTYVIVAWFDFLLWYSDCVYWCIKQSIGLEVSSEIKKTLYSETFINETNKMYDQVEEGTKVTNFKNPDEVGDTEIAFAVCWVVIAVGYIAILTYYICK